MNIKNKLKQRLLEIPIQSRAYRELHALADDVNGDLKKVELYLTELVQLDILEKKIQYVCPNCGDTTIMNNELLNELIDEDGYFQCDDCMEFIDPKINITGFIYYDIKNMTSLENW